MARTERTDIHQSVTDRIIRELEAGTVPWVCPWSRAKCGIALPRNAATDRAYSGINILMLWGSVEMQGFSTQKWLTFRQAHAQGGNVRKGEKGTTVFYADRFTPKSEAGSDEPRQIPFLKRFTVFNLDQCENLPESMVTPTAPLPEREIVPHAEALMRETGADIRIGGDKAFYAPDGDFIRVPPQQSYFNQIDWYRTVFHEIGHWTGSEIRLSRTFGRRFGDYAYAAEELVAEMTSAFVCAELQIEPTVRHADYIGNWLELLKADRRAIFTAASAASTAAQYIFSSSTRQTSVEDVASAA